MNFFLRVDLRERRHTIISRLNDIIIIHNRTVGCFYAFGGGCHTTSTSSISEVKLQLGSDLGVHIYTNCIYKSYYMLFRAGGNGVSFAAEKTRVYTPPNASRITPATHFVASKRFITIARREMTLVYPGTI